MYGNIGTRNRIEFAFIGKAANDAARTKIHCKELGETALVSDARASRLKLPWALQFEEIGGSIESLSRGPWCEAEN